MGNQNGVSAAINIKACPMNFLQRLAYSFCAGDMLTVIIRGNGDMIWDWGTDWEAETPNQENISRLVKNLNGWRNGAGKDYLVYGRMMKPLMFEGATNIPMITRTGKRNIDFPSVLTSNWESGHGSRSQIFVNYMPYEQKIKLDIDGVKNVRIFRSSSDTEGEMVRVNELEVSINPLSAVMVTYSDK